MVMTVIMLFAMAVPAFAYTQKYEYKVRDLKPGVAIDVKDFSSTYSDKTDVGTDTFDMLRFKVTEPGYVILYTNKASNSIELYKNFKRGIDLEYSESIEEYHGAKKYYQVLPKGTYYFHANQRCRIMYNFFPLKNASNYCRANAKVLASNKETRIMTYYGREHSRWFKITTTAKKNITAYIKRLDRSDSITVAIYNNKGRLIASCRGNKAIAVNRAAGTYYIKVWREEDESDDDYYLGRLVTLKWN
jgi:hypothetical protein